MVKKKEISVVVPVFNEEEGVLRFLDEELGPVLGFLEEEYKFTVIVVDDGSRDRTILEVEKSELFRKKKVKLVALSRNFGKEVALTAGIEYAMRRGEAWGTVDGSGGGDKKDEKMLGLAEAVVLIDGDGQHPVSAIPEMLEKWEKGAEVVTAVRKKTRKDGRRHRLGSKMYYKLYARLGNGGIREGEMDFKVIDRVVAEEFLRFSEHNRIVRGLIDYLGFSRDYVEVTVRERLGGKPSYNFRKLATLAADSIVSSSRVPLMLLGVIGVGIMIFSFVLGMFILVQQYILHDPLELGWSGAVAMCVFIAFLVGIVLVGQAVLGLYVAQIHIEAKNRSLFVVDRKRSRL